VLIGGLGVVSLFIASVASAMPAGIVKAVLLLIIAPVITPVTLGLCLWRLWRKGPTRVPEKAWLVLGLVSALIAGLVLVFTLYELSGA
jgi:hypothetical protein